MRLLLVILGCVLLAASMMLQVASMEEFAYTVIDVKRNRKFAILATDIETVGTFKYKVEKLTTVSPGRQILLDSSNRVLKDFSRLIESYLTDDEGKPTSRNFELYVDGENAL